MGSNISYQKLVKLIESKIKGQGLVSLANQGGGAFGWLDHVRIKPTQSSWAGAGTELGIIVPLIFAELSIIFQDHSLIEDACV